MRLSSQSLMSPLWEKSSPAFLPPLQLGGPPASGSIVLTPQWTVGSYNAHKQIHFHKLIYMGPLLYYSVRAQKIIIMQVSHCDV